MKRVIFVDDEPKVLEGIENLMFDYMDDWDMVFVDSGARALDELAACEYDVMVTDMRMPGMDGAELLERVKEAYPRMIRFVLSGHSEAEAALRALPITHQFLSKPCAPETLIGALERACSLERLVADGSVRAAVGDVASLPIRPAIYSRLLEILAGDDWSLADVGDEIARDIAISTKVLAVSNSAFFSRGRTVTDVRQAVSRLGVAFVTNLVLSLEVYARAKPPAGLDLEALHREGITVAAIAQKIAPRPLAADAFLAGLVHDIGRLVIATASSGEFATIRARASDEAAQPREIELELFGTTHAEVGAYFLGLWGMTYPVIEAVAHHHAPERIVSEEDVDVTGAVYIAATLRTALSAGHEPSFDPDYVNRAGIADRLADWQTTADRIMEDGHE